MENTPTLFEDLSGLLIDGMSANYKVAVTKGMQYYERRREEGFNEFHRQLLSGTATKEKIEYEQMFKITEDQYYALLSASINDEEKQKSHIYANVYRNILNENISKNKYSKIIRLAKSIPYSAIELLPIIYIYQNYHTKNKSLSTYLNELYREKRYELKYLDQSDIIQLPSGELQFSDSAVKIKDDFFNEIINIFFKKEDLLPEKHNIDLWRNKTAVILTDDPFGEEHPMDLIKDILKEESIPFEILTYQNIDFNSYSYIICVVTNINLDKTNKFDFGNLQFNTNIIRTTISQAIARGSILRLTEKEDIEKLKEQFSD